LFGGRYNARNADDREEADRNRQGEHSKASNNENAESYTLNLYPVIMCGGGGARLWPASRSSLPKQFVQFMGPLSLFQETVVRVSKIENRSEIVVIAGAAHEPIIKRQLAEVGVEAVLLLEPEGRDSSPAMAAACLWIVNRDADGVAAIIASDHYIPDAPAFRAAILSAATAALERSCIVTMGVRPSAPSTAYGYISPGEQQGSICAVQAFVEKPDRATAELYVAEGFLWNSGNFIATASTISCEIEEHAPSVHAAVHQALAAAKQDGASYHLGTAFASAPKASFDYAVMEKTDKAAVLPVDFEWSDLGAWNAIWETKQKDENGNSTYGECLALKSSNTLIHAGEGTQIVAIGVHDIAVVADSNQILVCNLGHAQDVKLAVEQLKREGRYEPKPRRSFSTLEDAGAWYDRWLKTSALPLWWSLGADHQRGGFHEALTPTGEGLDLPRRCRVQSRQAYVFARAGTLGWSGPWRSAATHAFSYLLEKYSREDGLFCALVSPDGEQLDASAMVYDQAFALLAMSALFEADVDAKDMLSRAHGLLDALRSSRNPAGGYREAGPQPFKSDPNMHLFEAALSWFAATGGSEWKALADDLARLAIERLIDTESGFIREFYDGNWRPVEYDFEREISPGHQFEWAWLLSQWQKLGDHDVSIVIKKLYEIGLKGVDPQRAVVVDALNDSMEPLRTSARLWPQTEFLRCALMMHDAPQALIGANALQRYLTTPASGLWYDVQNENGQLAEGHAPSSSLYHVIGAISEISSTR